MENNDFFAYSFLIRIKEFFKKNKDIIITTFIVGLIAHAYCFFNYLPTWDSIINTQTVGATFSSGRWLLKYAGMIFSDYSLSWINGIVSLLFIGLSVIMLAEVFDIKNSIYRSLVAALFVTFPAVTSTFTFIFTADCYMMAFFLVTSAVYVCHKYTKWGFVPAMILLACSIGIYQAYLSVFLVAVTILIIFDTSLSDIKFSELVKKYYKYIIAFIGGFVLYEVTLKLFLAVKGIELSSYQGINDTGVLPPKEMIRAFAVNILNLLNLYGIDLFDLNGRSIKIGLYSVICLLLLLAMLVLTITVIIKKQLYKKPAKIFLLIFEFFAMFIFAFVLRYTTVNIGYSAIMEMSVCLFYIIQIVFLLRLPSDSKASKVIKSITLTAFCILIVYNSVSSNVNYFYMHLRYERSYATAQNVINDIRESVNFDSQKNKVAVIGADYKTSENTWNDTLPTIRGSEDADTVLISQNHYIKFWHYFLGIDVNEASESEANEISKTDEFKNMPSYPNKGYIKEINGIIVAKISDKTPGKF